MKKVLFVVMAVVAIGFASCGNKTQGSAEATDSVAVLNVEDETAATINALAEQLEAKDANKLQEVLTAVQAKVKELIATDPEAAKNLVSQVQAFLKENAEKIKAFAGDNAAVASAVAALTETPAESIINSLSSLGDSVQNATKDAANQAVDKVGNMIDDASNKISETADAVANKIDSVVSDLSAKADNLVNNAKDAANKVKDAAEKALNTAMDVGNKLDNFLGDLSDITSRAPSMDTAFKAASPVTDGLLGGKSDTGSENDSFHGKIEVGGKKYGIVECRYRFQARQKNAGWRIDYFVISNRLRPQLSDALIHTDILGSDHCPVSLIL